MGFSRALKGIAAGLALPVSRRDEAVGVGFGEAVEDDLAFAGGGVGGAIRGDEVDGGVDAVAAAREQREAGAGGGLIFGLGQDARADRDDGIGGEDPLAGPKGGNRSGLFSGQPGGMGARRLGLVGGLVDVGGKDFGRGEAEAREKGGAARAGGSENEGGGCAQAGAQSSGAMVTRRPSSASVKGIWQDRRDAGVK